MTLREAIEQDTYIEMSDADVAASFNAPTGLLATRERAPKERVVILAEIVIRNLAGATDQALLTKWGMILPWLLQLLPACPEMMAYPSSMDIAVSDGLLTQQQADAPWKTTNGSLCESITGLGETIKAAQVGRIRRGEE